MTQQRLPHLLLRSTDRSCTSRGATVSLLEVPSSSSTALIMMVFLDRLVNKTKLGRSIRAVSEDAPTAALMGIDIDKTISRTFIIGGALAGVAGFLFGTAFGFAYLMGFTPGVKAFAAAVLGGIGNIRGAMIGGLLLGAGRGADGRAAVRIGTQWTRRRQLRGARPRPDVPADRHPRRAPRAGRMNGAAACPGLKRLHRLPGRRFRPGDDGRQSGRHPRPTSAVAFRHGCASSPRHPRRSC